MSFFKNLFGKKTAVEFNSSAFEAYFNAKTHTEERQVIEQYPDLLSNVYDNLFRQLIEQVGKESPGAEKQIEEKYQILLSCRRNGIEKTFAKRPDIVREGEGSIQKTMSEFLTAETWPESLKILEKHPELYCQEVASLYDLMDKSDNASIIKHAAVLRRCMSKGPQLAIQDEIDLFGPEKAGIDKVVSTILFSKSRSEIEKVLALSPELLKADIGSLLNDLKMALSGFPLEAQEPIIQRFRLIENVRRDGIKKGLAESVI